MRRIESAFSRNRSLLNRFFAAMVPLLCGVFLLSQTAFAQNTYVITDGDRVLVHTTYSTDPAAVLNEAGLELGADDTYITQEGNGVSEITVQRVQTVHVDYCGEQITVLANNETVGQLLERLNLNTEGVQVSVPMDTVVYEDMEFTVTCTIRTTQTYTRAIPHKTVYCEDDSLPEGEEKVLSRGSDGELVCTAEVTYRNGEQISRVVVNERVAAQPVDAVVAVGTGSDDGSAAPPTAADSKFRGGDGLSIGSGIITLPSGETLTYTESLQVVATAYTSTDEGCSTVTATGTQARVGAIAVDPTVIPYGTRMFIMTNDGEYVYGIATAEDCGGAITGKRIDLYFDTTAECFQFGVRDCTVYLLG